MSVANADCYCRKDSCGNVVSRVVMAFVNLIDDALDFDGNMLTGKSVPVSRILKSTASSMMDAGLIEDVSIVTIIKVSRMIWAYDGHRFAYLPASPRMFARKSFYARSQSKPEVRPRRSRVLTFLIGRK